MALVDDILDGDQVLTSAEAAARLGISVDALHRRPIPYAAVATHRRYLASNIYAWRAANPQDGTR